MTISFPLPFPTLGYNVSSATYFIRDISTYSENPNTLAQTTYEQDGEGWGLVLNFGPLDTSLFNVRPLLAFLASLNGKVGTFYYGDTYMKNPRGVVGGTPLVNGASQSGLTVATDGWAAGITNVLMAGDFINIGTSLHIVTANASSNGSGQATLDIWPRLRPATAIDNAPIVYTNPKGLYRVTSEIRWTSENGAIYTIDPIEAVEAL